MSMPEFPNLDIDVKITKEQSAILLIASVAFEELGLSHLINSEAEKIQYVLGTLKNFRTPPAHAPCVKDLIELNASVQQMLKNIIKTEMLLQFKLEEAVALLNKEKFCCPCFECGC